MPESVPTYAEFQSLTARVAALEAGAPVDPPVDPPDPPVDPPPIDPTQEHIRQSITVEELHNHHGITLIVDPGVTITIADGPTGNHDHADHGIVNHGTLIAIRNPTQPPIVFTSQNPSGNRGHLMSHGEMKLDGVTIKDMGRTRIEAIDPVNNPIARYAAHYHESATLLNSFIRNCVIFDTVPGFRHGIVVHSTNGVEVANNHIHHKAGAGIYLEDGTEVNNRILNNLIEDIETGGGRSDSREWNNERGHDGAGIWTWGGGNEITGNTSRRCPIGFTCYQPWGAWRSFAGTFSDNLAENCGTGWMPWNCFDGEIIRFTAKNCVQGVYNYNSWNLRYVDLSSDGCTQYGYYGGDYIEANLEFVNPQFSNCLVGYYPSPVQKWGLNVEVIGGRMFANGTDILNQILYSSNGGDTIEPRIVTLDGVSLESAIKIARRREGPQWHNHVQLDRLVWNGRKVYFIEQRADVLCPQTWERNIGCPVAGLTNAQALEQHGVCTGGEIAPASAHEESGIVGLVDG